MAHDLDGTIRHWSDVCERLDGYSPSEAIGRISHYFLKTRFLRPVEEIEYHFEASGEWIGELIHTRRDGTQVVVTTHKVLKEDADKALFTDESQDSGGSQFPERTKLSETFYQQLVAHPMPIEEAAIRAINRHSMALDIYCWHAYRLHVLFHETSIS